MDGCRGGWVVAIATDGANGGGTLRIDVARDFAEALAFAASASRIAVDMPIGLLDVPQPGGRACDRAARAVLGRQGSSVFSPPARPALDASDFRDAQRRQGAGLSIQTWNIVPRIREVDAAIDASMQSRVIEAHPELAFRALAGAPLERKSTADGFAERVALLRSVFGAALPDLVAVRRAIGPSVLKLDDLADACVLAFVARRADDGSARRLPDGDPPVDVRGLRMEIWY
jgi:predicted RNase H-like nuclease